MSRNVEVKARIEDVEALRARVATAATGGPDEIAQDDTFFGCPEGRLKLREFLDGSGELIFYRRPDLAGPKESFFLRSPTTAPSELRKVLTEAYGQVGRVVKHRTLFLIGRTRVHLDRVQGLGDFLELEVVLADHESLSDGAKEAHCLMDRLEILGSDLIEAAYVDLLLAPLSGCSLRLLRTA